jgi:hypothetical protein
MRLSRRPAGSGSAAEPLRIRAATPSAGPTQTAPVPPRTFAVASLSRSGPLLSSVSSACHLDQRRVSADRVRTSTAPDGASLGSVQVTLTMLNGSVSRSGRSAASALPGSRSILREIARRGAAARTGSSTTAGVSATGSSPTGGSAATGGS